MENQSARAIAKIVNRFVSEARKTHSNLSTVGNSAKKKIIANSRGFCSWADFEKASNKSAFTSILTTYYGQKLDDASRAFYTVDDALFNSGETAEFVAHDFCYRNKIPLVSIQVLNEESNVELEVFLNSKGYAFYTRIREANDGNVYFWINPRISDSHSDGKQYTTYRANLLAALTDYKSNFEDLDFAEKEKALVLACSLAMRQAHSHDDALRKLYLDKYGFFSSDDWNIEDLSYVINKLDDNSKFKEELNELWDSI